MLRVNLAKDKRASRRGQITKAKTKLDEFLARHIEEISIISVQSALIKLRKDLQLHEAIQARYVELLTEGDTTPSLIQEEEDASIDVYEEHQELLRQYEELRDCLLCHQDVKKIVRKYLLLKDTSSMNVSEYEDEILKFRTSFDNIMDKLHLLSHIFYASHSYFRSIICSKNQT